MLPVDQYPKIVPPVVRVSTSYPGANSQTVSQAVATPIEQSLNGTPGMLYMESSNSNNGGYSATLTFDISTDPDLAAVEVQKQGQAGRVQTSCRSRAERNLGGEGVLKQADDDHRDVG